MKRRMLVSLLAVVLAVCIVMPALAIDWLQPPAILPTDEFYDGEGWEGRWYAEGTGIQMTLTRYKDDTWSCMLYYYCAPLSEASWNFVMSEGDGILEDLGGALKLADNGDGTAAAEFADDSRFRANNLTFKKVHASDVAAGAEKKWNAAFVDDSQQLHDDIVRYYTFVNLYGTDDFAFFIQTEKGQVLNENYTQGVVTQHGDILTYCYEQSVVADEPTYLVYSLNSNGDLLVYESVFIGSMLEDLGAQEQFATACGYVDRTFWE